MNKKAKYDHNKTMAAYRKADRTAFGQKHGNSKRQMQQDTSSAHAPAKYHPKKGK